MEINKEKALEIITNALNAANTKGVFNLQDAVIVHNSLELIKKVFIDYDHIRTLEKAFKDVREDKNVKEITNK